MNTTESLQILKVPLSPPTTLIPRGKEVQAPANLRTTGSRRLNLKYFQGKSEQTY